MNQEIYVCEEVHKVNNLFEPALAQFPSHQKISDFLQDLINLMGVGYIKGDDAIAVLMTNHHPDLVGESSFKIMSEQFTTEEYRSVILFDHGFSTWAEAEDAGTVDIEFEKAVECVISGDIPQLIELLNLNPELISGQSGFGHKAGLSDYVAANGVEIWRQKVPLNAPQVLELLLEKGANLEQNNNIYGGSSLKSLIESSDHPNMAGVADDLMSLLK
jgi:hypothetical protein